MSSFSIIMWKPLLIIYFGQLHFLQADPSLRLCSSPIKAQNCTLECSDTTITATVKFEHPNNTLQGSCIIPGNIAFCTSANYTIYQNLPITYLNITSLDRNRDEGEWRCVHGSSGSPGQILYVSSPLVTQTTPQVIIAGSSLTVTCEMPCQYPTSAVTVEIIYAEEGSTNYGPFSSAPTVVTDFTDNTGCDSYESNYKAEFTLNKSNISSSLLNKKLTFKCNFTHSMIQESTGDTGPASASIEIKFPDLETTTQSSITTEGTTTTTTSTNKRTQHHVSSSSPITPSTTNSGTTNSPRIASTKNMVTNSVSVTTPVHSTNDNNKGVSKKSNTTYIIIGSVGGSALLVLICVVAIVLKKRVSSKSNSLRKPEQYQM